MKRARFKYVDLFAGCGGLSLGLEQAGFELALAVEKSPMAAETFYHNLISRICEPWDFKQFSAHSTPVEVQAARKLVVKALSEVLESKPLLERLKTQGIDLVAGGPPCQGFSLAGRRNPDDARNKLAWQFLEFVDAVAPKAVIIENVSGMSQAFKKGGKPAPFDELRKALEGTGPKYRVQPVLLNARDYGVPQHRPRVMLLGLRADLAGLLDCQFYDVTWKSGPRENGTLPFPSRPGIAPRETHGPAAPVATNGPSECTQQEWLTVADAISDLDANGYVGGANLTSFANDMRGDVPGLIRGRKPVRPIVGPANHVLRKHSAGTQDRFRLYQYLKDAGIDPSILAIPKMEALSDAVKGFLVGKALDEGMVLPAKDRKGVVIAKSVEELVDLVMACGTKKHSQRPLEWDKPSPTVLSLPDDFVHPGEPRTLTVREMARLQSFPDAFEFRAKETSGGMKRRVEVPQYTQVGNAVPPRMARAVGLRIKSLLQQAKDLQPRKAG